MYLNRAFILHGDKPDKGRPTDDRAGADVIKPVSSGSFSHIDALVMHVAGENQMVAVTDSKVILEGVNFYRSEL